MRSEHTNGGRDGEIGDVRSVRIVTMSALMTDHIHNGLHPWDLLPSDLLQLANLKDSHQWDIHRKVRHRLWAMLRKDKMATWVHRQ